MKTQVLIIGAGPVGLMAALLLSNQGISSIIVERRLERMTAPKAHAVNCRTIEICDQAGVSGDLIRSHGTPPEKAGWVRFVSKLASVEFGALTYERQTDETLAITPFPLINISQPRFEQLVASELQKKDNVCILRGAEANRLEETADGVTAHVLLRGVDAPIEIAANYVLAADGAGSRTRDRLGIKMEGPEALQNYVMIHCEGDLGAFIDHRPGVLYFNFHPDAGGAFIIYDDTKSWVFMKSYDPAVESADAFDEERCRREVINAIGSDTVDFSVRNISPWTMSAQIAEHYRSGRVFLIGDAAHRFPPTGGLGLNTGVGDAQNVCWKIAHVLKGQALESLLDTYEVERRPVAVNNSTQSMTNAAKIVEVFSALYGDDPAKLSEHFLKACERPQENEALQAAINAQKPHFDSIQLQLGYRYHSEALKGSAAIEPPADDDISQYTPSYDVGALLPHEWIMVDGEKQSILSRLAHDRFTLICASSSQPPQCEFDDLHIVEGPAGWEERAGVSGTGALLIRPDGHIAARYANAGALRGDTVKNDLNKILGREG